MNYLTIKNNQRISLTSIPVMPYEIFYDTITGHLMKAGDTHCVNYFGFPSGEQIKLICCIAKDSDGIINILSCVVQKGQSLLSITPQCPSFHIFEREIYENYDISFSGHPWLKPVRYSSNRSDPKKNIANFPFYQIESEELHTVGVGPIHAGIIEPGHFRFICNGEQILHLEIQLGYQHRGIEQLFLQKKNILQLATLAENIAGDNVIGHATAFTNAWESLCGFQASDNLQIERALALEIERIAIYTGDLSAICTDIAYQLGSSVFGRLRTPVINYFQEWCGNRLAKSLIRPGGTNFPFTPGLLIRWFEMIKKFEPHLIEMAEKMFDLPSVLSRLERTGEVNTKTAKEIGMVGMAARASGLARDIRYSHPYGFYEKFVHQPVLLPSGDVYARTRIRYEEILESIDMISEIKYNMPENHKTQQKLKAPEPSSFVISLVEGWRGEICHCAITDDKGDIVLYKIKDPSFHNWFALAQAVRNNEISDFPVCNKSFNLSYSGHDL